MEVLLTKDFDLFIVMHVILTSQHLLECSAVTFSRIWNAERGDLGDAVDAQGVTQRRLEIRVFWAQYKWGSH